MDYPLVKKKMGRWLFPGEKKMRKENKLPLMKLFEGRVIG
jgi:hypothetical protein